MKTNIFENTRVAAYFLWKYTNNERAMDLWGCAEDFAFYLEKENIISIKNLYDILKKGRKEEEYVNFVRNLSYRVYLYIKNNDRNFNWFVAENLINNSEFCYAAVNVANAFRVARNNLEELTDVRSEWIKSYYARHQVRNEK